MEIYPLDLAIHIVNIVILYILLRVLVFKPVRKFMLARENRIQGEMDAAKAAQALADETRATYEEKLKTAEETVAAMLEDGRKQAAAAAGEADRKAQADAGALLTAAKADAEEEKQKILAAAAPELSRLAVEMAGRVLRFEEGAKENLLRGKTELQGTREGVLRTAAPCSDEDFAAIRGNLEQLLGTHLTLTREVDERLVGGYAAYVDGKVYDFSYAAQLSAMARQLS